MASMNSVTLLFPLFQHFLCQKNAFFPFPHSLNTFILCFIVSVKEV